MTRFPERPKRENVPPEELAAYDAVFERQSKLWGDPGDYWSTLLHCPPLAEWWNDGGAFFIAGNTGYTAAQREWVDMVICQEIGCTIIYIGHMPDAVAVGVRPEAIKALRDGRDEDLEPDELTLAKLIRETIAGNVTDETYDAAVALLGVRGALSYAAFATRLWCNDRMMRYMDLEMPPESAVDELLQTFLDGTAELPDPLARIG